MVHTPKYARIITPGEILYVEAHYRETHLGPTAQQAWAQGKVVFAEGTRKQLAHAHHVTDLTRFGDGICHSCGLNMWSPSWLSAGVMGEATETYMVECIRAWTERVDGDAFAFEYPASDPVKALTAIAILADLHDDKPALLTGTKGSVPAMQRGVLT